MTIQWVSSAIVWVARVVHHTDDNATIAPTLRSMPPPVITKVIPMLTTPMTEASLRMVSTLSTSANRSPAVTVPTTQITTSATTRPRLRPALLRSTAIAPPEDSAGPGAFRLDPAALAGGADRVVRHVHVGVLAHATLPSITRSSTLASSRSVAGASWTTAPSRTTSTRSDRPRTSSTSLETTTTATPASARLRISW